MELDAIRRRLHGLTVLIVDDNKDVRELLSIMLREVGAIPVAVGTAEAAIRALDTVVCHVVVTDLSLPDQDGVWLLEEVHRRRETLGGIPVIALTGYSRPPADVGFARYLIKPVDPMTVIDVIASVVEPGRA